MPGDTVLGELVEEYWRHRGQHCTHEGRLKAESSSEKSSKPKRLVIPTLPTAMFGDEPKASLAASIDFSTPSYIVISALTHLIPRHQPHANSLGHLSRIGHSHTGSAPKTRATVMQTQGP